MRIVQHTGPGHWPGSGERADRSDLFRHVQFGFFEYVIVDASVGANLDGYIVLW